MRSKKAALNVISALLLQLANIISGLIVPSMIIHHYGSNVNGLIVSITQFLNYISLLDGGIGGVTKAALYQPLAEHDNAKTSAILSATTQFFRQIACVFIAYVFLLSIFYPKLIQTAFSTSFIVSLIAIIGINTLTQYFFGITNQLLIQAAQKSYLIDFMQIGAILVNIIVVVALVAANASIQLVKLISVLIFLLRPIVQAIYVRKRYCLISRSSPDKNAIAQRWDGLGQHIAYFVNTNTDVVVLTIFSTISEVSVYSVYAMVASGLCGVVYALSNGFSAALGDMVAKNEQRQLRDTFDVLEWINSNCSIVFFSTAAIMILPFVQIYTAGVSDTDYLRPAFAMILFAAELMYCLRYPFVTLTNAAGHYRQTRNGAFAEAGINMVISLCLVKQLGLEGVAVGTLCAMIFRTLNYILYLSQNILFRKPIRFIWSVFVNIVGAAIGVLILRLLPLWNIQGYFDWAISALSACIILFITTNLCNIIFNKKKTLTVFRKIKSIMLGRQI